MIPERNPGRQDWPLAAVVIAVGLFAIVGMVALAWAVVEIVRFLT